MLKLRQQAGLTQVELAAAIGVNQATIALWERSATPPKSQFMPEMAEILGVRIEDLIFRDEAPTPTVRSRPVGQVQLVFEEVRKLPRNQQRKVLETVVALVEQYKRKESA